MQSDVDASSVMKYLINSAARTTVHQLSSTKNRFAQNLLRFVLFAAVVFPQIGCTLPRAHDNAPATQTVVPQQPVLVHPVQATVPTKSSYLPVNYATDTIAQKFQYLTSSRQFFANPGPVPTVPHNTPVVNERVIVVVAASNVEADQIYARFQAGEKLEDLARKMIEPRPLEAPQTITLPEVSNSSSTALPSTIPEVFVPHVPNAQSKLNVAYVPLHLDRSSELPPLPPLFDANEAKKYRELNRVEHVQPSIEQRLPKPVMIPVLAMSPLPTIPKPKQPKPVGLLPLPLPPMPDRVPSILPAVTVPTVQRGAEPMLPLPPISKLPPLEMELSAPRAMPPTAPPPAAGTIFVDGQPIASDRLLPFAGEQRLTGGSGMGCESCGSSTTCDAGCVRFPKRGPFTRLIGGVYEALVCPDPCYQPRWQPLADAALFTAAARPVTQTGFRWDYTYRYRIPDRAEYLFARSDGNGKGPAPGFGVVANPFINMHELVQYTEVASGAFGFSVSTPYRSWNSRFSGSSAGFADITLGTKSLLMDSELFMLAFQFNTTLPTGNPLRGRGTGHVSLEPSLIAGLRVSPKSFLQLQIAEWIPLGGDPTYSGAILHYHAAFNHVLWKPIRNFQVIGTFEMHGFSFQDGGYTDPDLGFRKSSGTNVLQLGPGIRTFFGDKYDFGVGSSFGVTGRKLFEDQLRVDLRIRF